MVYSHLTRLEYSRWDPESFLKISLEQTFVKQSYLIVIKPYITVNTYAKQKQPGAVKKGRGQAK